VDNLDLMRDRPALASGGPRFSPQLLFRAATLYDVRDATQAEIADQLGTSRASVRRLLSEARRQRIVRIDVIEPVETDLSSLPSSAWAQVPVSVSVSVPGGAV
jgi:transposase-like protein